MYIKCVLKNNVSLEGLGFKPYSLPSHLLTTQTKLTKQAADISATTFSAAQGASLYAFPPDPIKEALPPDPIRIWANSIDFSSFSLLKDTCLSVNVCPSDPKTPGKS